MRRLRAPRVLCLLRVLRLTRVVHVAFATFAALAAVACLSCRAPAPAIDTDPVGALALRTRVPRESAELLASKGTGLHALGDTVLVVDVTTASWREKTGELRRQLDSGVVAFAATRPSGATTQIAITAASHPLEPLGAMSTSGPATPTAAVIERMLVWDGAFGVRLEGAGAGWLAVKPVFKIPTNVLAEEVATLCAPAAPATEWNLDELAAAIERDDLIDCTLR
jgi:hypothetical protein